MDGSPLARLLPELRNRIYEFALFRPEGVLIPFSPSNRSYLPRSPNAQLALTTVCREVRAETTLLFYAVNTFVLQTHASDPGVFLDIKGHDLCQWLNMFGPGRVQILVGVSLHLGTFEDNNTRLADLGKALSRVHRQLIKPACEAVGFERLQIAFELEAGFACRPSSQRFVKGGESVILHYHVFLRDGENARRGIAATQHEAKENLRRRDLTASGMARVAAWHETVTRALLALVW